MFKYNLNPSIRLRFKFKSFWGFLGYFYNRFAIKTKREKHLYIKVSVCVTDEIFSSI